MKHEKLVCLLVCVVAVAILFSVASRHSTRLTYTRVLFSEKLEETFGFGKSAKWEILDAHERLEQRPEDAHVLYWKSTGNTTTTLKKLKGNKTYSGGGSPTTTVEAVIKFRQDAVAQESWDSRFEYMLGVLNGSPELSCGRDEVVIVAILGDGFVWERTVKVLEDDSLQVDPPDNATVWVRVSADAGEDLYRQFEVNQSKVFLYPKAVEYWLMGDVKAYPIERIGGIASCVMRM